MEDVRGLRRLIRAVDEEFTKKDSNHLRRFIDGGRSIIDIKWIGKTRAIRMEEYMQYDRYRPEGQRLVRDLRAFFRKRSPEALEKFLRTDVKMRDDGAVLYVMSQILQKGTWNMQFPFVETLKGAGPLTNATDFICHHYFTLREDGRAMVRLLEEHTTPKRARALMKKYIKA